MMMPWFTRLRLRLRSLLRRHTLEPALHQELDFHLAEQKAECVALGMTESEAELAVFTVCPAFLLAAALPARCASHTDPAVTLVLR